MWSIVENGIYFWSVMKSLGRFVTRIIMIAKAMAKKSMLPQFLCNTVQILASMLIYMQEDVGFNLACQAVASSIT